MHSRTILIFGGKAQGNRNGLKTTKMALEIDVQQFLTGLPSQLQHSLLKKSHGLEGRQSSKASSIVSRKN